MDWAHMDSSNFVDEHLNDGLVVASHRTLPYLLDGNEDPLLLFPMINTTANRSQVIVHKTFELEFLLFSID